jgi:hypothetical protein
MPINNQTSAATMYSYMSHFFSGTLDPDWPHAILIGGAIVGSIIVAFGIVLEAEKLFSLPTVLVVGGVSIEAIFTLLLFGFDEGISSNQQSTIQAQNSEIIALEKRLAARILSDEQAAAIAEKVKPFAGQVFQVIPYWKNPESLSFANRIAGILISSGWKLDQPTAFTTLVGVLTGINVEIDAGETEEVKGAATTLFDALSSSDAFATLDDTFKREPPSHRVSISVGIKP